MDPLHEPSNQEILSSLAGPAAARELCSRHPTLEGLSRLSLAELSLVPGVGPSKARAIRNAFLLGQRLAREVVPEVPLIDTPEAAAQLLRPEFRFLTEENCYGAALNTRKRLIGIFHIAKGSVDSLIVTPQAVFAPAVHRRAAAIVLAHNHPSGDPTPSGTDISRTRELFRAGRVLGIEVLDHLIIGLRTPERQRDYVSLRELGCLN